MTSGGPRFGYPPVYFPSAADFDSAAVIHLKVGETFSASLSPPRREYYPVKLNVLNARGEGLGVSVEPQAHHGPGYSLGFNPNESSIEGMLPNGVYTVEVARYGAEGASGSLNLSVNGAPVAGPTVTLVPNAVIPVLMRDERTKPDSANSLRVPNLANAFQISLVSEDEYMRRPPFYLRGSQNPGDDSAQIMDVPPGTYRVRSACQPWGYVAAVSSGGRDLLQQPLVVAPGAAVPTLEVSIRDDGAELQGQIDDWSPQNFQPRPSFFTSFRNGPAGPTVLLVSTSEGGAKFCQSWIDQNGQFHFPQVPPGDYRALAFEHFPVSLDYENSEALQQYGSKAQELHLIAGQKEHVRLALVVGSE
jgi:hypothetical protein